MPEHATLLDVLGVLAMSSVFGSIVWVTSVIRKRSRR